MKRTWGLGLLSLALVVGACAHIYDDGMGEGNRYDRVAITGPENGAQIRADHLEVEGTSTEGAVQVAVFDPYDRIVTRSSLAVRDGRWSTRFNLRDGRYRIRVSGRHDEERSRDEVRIAYRDESLRRGSGWGNRAIAINEPRSGEVINAGTVDRGESAGVSR